MTVIAQVNPLDQPAICAGPGWCDEHIDDPPSGALHRRSLGRFRDSLGQRVLSLSLEQEDGTSGPGVPRISVEWSGDGSILDGSAELELSTAESYAYSILSLVAESRTRQR